MKVPSPSFSTNSNLSGVEDNCFKSQCHMIRILICGLIIRVADHSADPTARLEGSYRVEFSLWPRTHHGFAVCLRERCVKALLLQLRGQMERGCGASVSLGVTLSICWEPAESVGGHFRTYTNASRKIYSTKSDTCVGNTQYVFSIYSRWKSCTFCFTNFMNRNELIALTRQTLYKKGSSWRTQKCVFLDCILYWGGYGLRCDAPHSTNGVRHLNFRIPSHIEGFLGKHVCIVHG